MILWNKTRKPVSVSLDGTGMISEICGLTKKKQKKQEVMQWFETKPENQSVCLILTLVVLF